MSGARVSPRSTEVGYRAGRCFDGERMLAGGALVLVRGERIAGVLPADAPVPAGVDVHEHPGATLMPGMIDAHVHLCADGSAGALERDPARSPGEREAVIEEALRSHLRAGVTAVRDLGDHHWAVAQRGTRAGEPTVVASGPPITTWNGHCASMGGEAAGPSQLRRAVAERAERRVDVVKIVVSGGAMTAGSDLLSLQYGQEDVALVVREAHAAGLPVTAHAHSLASVDLCVAAGVDGIEHATCLTRDGLVSPPGTIRELAVRAIAVCPTLGRLPGSSPSEQAVEVARRTGWSLDGRLRQVGDLHRGGVNLISGSDAGIHPGKPHGGLAHAVAELVTAGVPVLQALASATSGAADACGLGARTGRLRPGMDADLLVVDGDPSADVTGLTRLRAVVSRGHRVPIRGAAPPPRS